MCALIKFLKLPVSHRGNHHAVAWQPPEAKDGLGSVIFTKKPHKIIFSNWIPCFRWMLASGVFSVALVFVLHLIPDIADKEDIVTRVEKWDGFCLCLFLSMVCIIWKELRFYNMFMFIYIFSCSLLASIFCGTPLDTPAGCEAEEKRTKTKPESNNQSLSKMGHNAWKKVVKVVFNTTLKT